MRLFGYSLPRAFAQLRSVTDRAALGLLVTLSVLLLVLGKADLKLAGYVGDSIGDVAAPLLAVFDEPLLAARAGLDRLGELLAVYRENDRLREENRRLLAWQAEAARLSVQNRELRNMLNIPEVERAPAWTTARVVGDAGGPFIHTLLIDAGAERGVRKGMAAVTPQGMVGRIISVGRRSSRMLLITDYNSKIPVTVERSGDHAVLEGDNSAQPALRFLPLNPSFQVGDLVLTSGDGGLMPAGLLIGRVSAVDKRKVAVTPFADWSRLDYVSVLLYEGLPPPEADPAAPIVPGGSPAAPAKPPAAPARKKAG
jgi:rod shape-determining protein MreC